MARFHGKDARVYLGKRDVSGDLQSIDFSVNMETHDVTSFASNDYREFLPGIGSWEASINGFYESNSGVSSTTIERQFEDILGVSQTEGISALSIYYGDADAVGDTGYITGNGTLNKFNFPITVADIIKMSGTVQGRGKPGVQAVLLHPLFTDSTTTTGTSFNGTAQSTSGGIGTIHVTAATGTGGDVKIQHSTNGSTWVDLITFTTISNVATCESIYVSGTVYQYLRTLVTPNATSSITSVIGFSRY